MIPQVCIKMVGLNIMGLYTNSPITNSCLGQLINTAKKDWPHLLTAQEQGVSRFKYRRFTV